MKSRKWPTKCVMVEINEVRRLIVIKPLAQIKLQFPVLATKKCTPTSFILFYEMGITWKPIFLHIDLHDRKESVSLSDAVVILSLIPSFETGKFSWRLLNVMTQTQCVQAQA